MVVTTAHCLPRFPVPYAGSDLEERTHKRLIGPLGEKTTVWAECLFADPVADLAVLGAPDERAFFEECEASG